jgi:ectoine hydroxylase-related dioxygenase (phytanoyl-CoA dioxygenase family)
MRHHQLKTVLAMYYPQDITADMGPTVLMPGSHFRNAPTDRMATYANLRDQVVVTAKAGTVAITHYDIWHAASRNSSQKTRYMLKFLFNRMSEPAAPSWNHTEEGATRAMSNALAEVYTVSQSDLYTERNLRRQLWHHLLGQPYQWEQ